MPNTCPVTKKERYKSSHAARAESQRRGWAYIARPYQCPHCSAWHLTRSAVSLKKLLHRAKTKP